MYHSVNNSDSLKEAIKAVQSAKPHIKWFNYHLCYNIVGNVSLFATHWTLDKNRKRKQDREPVAVFHNMEWDSIRSIVKESVSLPVIDHGPGNKTVSFDGNVLDKAAEIFSAWESSKA